MNISKTLWYFILFVILAIITISLNELGFGVISLVLLFPTTWLMYKAFETKKPSE